ncbi:LOW QUALITY PROTEIN: TPR repeat-containing protein DDB_G0287407-like [Clytia hemisphaerica]|uniref:LOW QUALITY PROTEIN: TPR repeat-containing protein DDB_G0287407-like n=1 Tax=Clytia hemisphaerica TaxID=252671 RepID=UPI0034D71551
MAEISYADAAKTMPENVEEMWELVEKTSLKESFEVLPVKNRRGWRTIRIFVSSTFKDFLNEREILVKELFPDLRLWCEERKLRLIECDLKWGVPIGTTGSETIQICLGELDRCCEENHVPFFLNLCAERVGWIPTSEELTANLTSHYGWVHGLSITEMEIVHGALRKMNPNALFMIREADSLEGLPDHIVEAFKESNERSVEKLSMLKTKVAEAFPSNHHFYQVKGNYVKDDDNRENVTFEGLNGDFYQKVFLFQKRIEMLYPLEDSPEDPIEVQREAHLTFMETRSKSVLGRDQQLGEIQDYIRNDQTYSPLVLVGQSGAGKSSIIARSARDVCDMIDDGQLSGKVFVHFVGATPGSTDLVSFLKRIVAELSPDNKESISDLQGYVQLVCRLLSKEEIGPVYLFIDAINQMDEDKQYYLARWLPCQLAQNIRVVISTIENTDTHQILTKFVPAPKEIACGPLDETSREEIVRNILRDYTKELHPDQMRLLISKKGSSNPLWLAVACEELRVEAVFETVTSMIEAFPNELIDMEVNLINRLVRGENGDQIKSALLLLEVSRHGLLETELMELLAEKNLHLVGSTFEEGDENEKVKPGCKKTIPARDWAIIYRNIKQLLRPCGNLGDGRLDFYHRSLSKAVRKQFLSGSPGEEKKHVYVHWHRVLADYFEKATDDDRRAEELPYHLEQLSDSARLEKCLIDWNIFNRLYDEHFAVELIRFWKAAGGYEAAARRYTDSLGQLKETEISRTEFSEQQYKVANFLKAGGQFRQAHAMMLESIAIEEAENTVKIDPFRVAQMCHWTAYCKRALSFKEPTPEEKIKSFEEAIETYHKSNAFLDRLTCEESEVLRGRSNCGMAHVMLKISDEKKTHDSDEFQSIAAPLIKSSVDVLEKYNAIRYLIDALGTQSLIVPNGPEFFEEKKRIRMRALDLCLRTFGEVHDLFVTKSRNFGAILKKADDYESAYDWYHRSLVASTKLYGPEHSYTQLVQKDLQDPVFTDIAERRFRSAEETKLPLAVGYEPPENNDEQIGKNPGNESGKKNETGASDDENEPNGAKLEIAERTDRSGMCCFL